MRSNILIGVTGDTVKIKGGTVARHVKQRIRRLVLTTNYRLGNFKNVVWLVGDGRSGTTWVSSLINWRGTYREVFEPFSPHFVDGVETFALHQYLRPDANWESFYKMARRVFSGQFMNSRSDRTNKKVFYKGLLIKDIFANLFITWVVRNFPEVKIVLLIRNPFAVALSKYKKKDWLWLTEPQELLKQKELYDDYLRPFEDVTRNVRDSFITKQVLIWAIIHYVPLLQLQKNNVYVAFYEDIYRDPAIEVAKILEYANSGYVGVTDWDIRAVVGMPSMVAGPESNIVRGTNPLEQWKRELSEEEIREGLSILRSFGLHIIYRDGIWPQKDALKALHRGVLVDPQCQLGKI